MPPVLPVPPVWSERAANGRYKKTYKILGSTLPYVEKQKTCRQHVGHLRVIFVTSFKRERQCGETHQGGTSVPGGGFTLPLPPPNWLGPDTCWHVGGGCPSPGASKTAQDPPKTLPRRSKTALRRSKALQDAPKTSPRRSKTPQDAPRRLQDASKTRFWWIWGAKTEASWHQNRILKRLYVKIA